MVSLFVVYLNLVQSSIHPVVLPEPCLSKLIVSDWSLTGCSRKSQLNSEIRATRSM